jgi:hypothetical protein
VRHAALALALALLCLRPPAVEAQDQRLVDRLDGPTAGRVAALVDSARVERLPTEPLVQKALEGATMGASGERITRAVQVLRDNLRGARSALGTEATEPELVAGAASLRAGVPAASLRELRATRRGQPLAVPLAVLTDLIAGGTPMPAAEASVLALARDGGADADFLALRRRLERERETGSEPEPSVRPRGMPAPGAPVAP